MSNNRLLLYGVLFIVMLSGCQFFSQNPDEEAVARVGDEYLLISDLDGLVGKNLSTKDSIETIENYIDKWIKQQVVLQKAEQNLRVDQLNVEQKLEEYRRSLLVYRYEKELVKQNLDTIVSDKEIKDYYDSHQDEFILRDNIVKVRYVKVKEDAPNQRQLASFIKSDKEEDRQKLEEFCSRYAVNYFLNDDSWLYFNDLLKEIPINTYNQENYLKNNRYIVERDSLFKYYVYIQGFKTKKSTSPIAFEKQRIRDIILNKRKMELIQTMEKAVLDEAYQENKIKIYKAKDKDKT
ncbi:MAG: hypothetical protein ACQESZ_05335 [Bacteroidota bacterium]